MEIIDGTIKITTKGSAVGEPVQDRAVDLSRTTEKKFSKEQENT